MTMERLPWYFHLNPADDSRRDHPPPGSRCEDGRLLRHDPAPDDPYLETDIGQCRLIGTGAGLCSECAAPMTAADWAEKDSGRIITSNIYPPIPDCRFDWVAYHDGDEETGHAGYGRTKAEAIADLERLDRERAEGLEIEDLQRRAREGDLTAEAALRELEGC